MPKVSVIIPNYNHAEFLSQRIDSVLNQTFPDFEVIILDDCSKDNSRAVLMQYQHHPKVSHLVFNEQNSGSTFKQWEKGIELATGTYIWIAESDDWCEPTLLEHLLDGFNQDPECVVSFCQSYFIRDTNRITDISPAKFLSEMVDGHTFLKERLLLHNPIFNASMVLWKRELFTGIPKEFKNYKMCGDWCFWMEVVLFGKVHVSGRVLNYFRKHANDVSGKAMRSGLDLLETVKIINYFYQRKLITDRDYYKAFKKHFKQYYATKNYLDPKISADINHLFKHPLTSKSIYLKMLPSAAWQRLVKKKTK